MRKLAPVLATANGIALRGLILVALFVASLPVIAGPVHAAEPITITATPENRWPDSIVFTIEAAGPAEIQSLTLRYRWGKTDNTLTLRAREADAPPDDRTFAPGQRVRGTLTIRTSGTNYVPPFAEMRYTVTAEDRAGNRTTTEEQTFLYQDTRFTWSTIEQSPLTVYYYGNNRATAERVLRAALAAINDIPKAFGIQFQGNYRLVLYNSKPDMDRALPPDSATTRRELVIEGQAHNEYSLVLVLDSQNDEVVTRHELTHVVTYQATNNPFTEIPFWLNEGLAVYNQGNGGVEYVPYLQNAIRSNTLIPIRNLTGKPGKPEDILLGYGQGYSIVKYLVETYGPEKMAALLAAYKDGNTDDLALRKVYGFDRDGLEDEWRQAIGARPRASSPPAVTPASGNASRPTVPTPRPVAPPDQTGSGTGTVAGGLLLFVGLGGAALACLVVLGVAGFLIALAFRRR